MSRLITRANAVRLLLLLVVAALAASTHQIASSGAGAAPATAVDVQVDWHRAVAGVTPGRTLTPLPAPALQPAAHRRPRHDRSRARSRHHRRGVHARLLHHRHRRPPHSAGGDVSWPQCPLDGPRRRRGEPMPGAGVKFVVIGLTSGRAFSPNPCLRQHLRWAQSRHLSTSAYAFAAFPSRGELRRHRQHGPYDGHTRAGRLRNAGFAAARFNVRLMRRHGFVTPHVWLDIEPSSSHPWSHHRRLNRAVVGGWIGGYRAAGYTVGFYSTQLLWQHILGGYRPGLPEWRTAGPSSRRAAARTCRGAGSFQGGGAVIAQWWTRHRDFDRLCTSASRDVTMRQYFHQW